MDDEIKHFQLDRPLRGKSQEAMRKHSIASQYENKPVERALFLLSKGEEMQKLSVLHSIPQLYGSEQAAVLQRILPKIQQDINSASAEFQITTSIMVKILLEKDFPRLAYLINLVYQGIDARDSNVANAWLDALLNVIPLLPKQSISKEVLPLGLKKGSSSLPVHSRLASLRILSKVAQSYKFEGTEMKDVVAMISSLSSDKNPEVRATVCQQMHNFMAVVDAQLLKSVLLPITIRLAADDCAPVKSASVSAMVSMIPFVEKEQLKTVLIPILLAVVENGTKRADFVAMSISKEMGKLVSNLKMPLAQADSKVILATYRELCRKGLELKDSKISDASVEVAIRQFCAQSMPDVIFYVLSHCADMLEEMLKINRSLVNDPCYIVRRAIGSLLHIIAQHLGPKCKMIHQDLVNLLNDDVEEVLNNVMPHLGEVLLLLVQNGHISPDTYDSPSQILSKALVKCHICLTRGFNWRLSCIFLTQMEYLPMCFSGDYIHHVFTPLILNWAVEGRAKPTRSQATRTLLLILRWNSKPAQQMWVRDHIVKEIRNSECCHTRVLFAPLCQHALDIFSYDYFKSFFFTPLITMLNDKVNSVRLSVIMLLPQLRQLLNTSPDNKLEMVFTDMVRKMESRETERTMVEMLTTNYPKKGTDSNAVKSAREVEEKRRVDEEERIAKGKLTMLAYMKEREKNGA